MKRLLSIILAAAMLLSLASAALADDLKPVTVMCPSERRADHPLSRVDEYTCYQVFAEWLAERGVKLEFDLVPKEQYDTTLDMRLNAQLELSDIVSLNWNYSDADAVQMAQDGVFINILEACEKYDEDGSIWNYIDSLVPEIRGLTTAPDGGIYWFVYPFHETFYYLDDNGVPQPYPYCKASPKGVININKDWLDKCGIEYSMFMTPEQLKDALVAFREQDANGDGAANEVLDIDITSFGNGIAACYGLFGLACVLDNGDVHCAWYADGIKDYLQYMKDLYDIGVYDTAALSDGMIDQIAAANQASAFAAYFGWSSPADLTKQDYAYAPIIVDDDEGVNGFQFPNRDGTSAMYMKFAITNECEDVAAAIAVFDAVYTKEYSVLSYYGTEKTYEVNDYGFLARNYDSALLNDPEWLDLPLMYSVAMNALPAVADRENIVDDTIKNVSYASPDECLAFIKYVYANDDRSLNNISAAQMMALPTEEELETISSLSTVLSTYSSELLTDLILGRKNIEDLDQYIGEMKALGLDDYLAVFQARHDRYVASQAE